MDHQTYYGLYNPAGLCHRTGLCGYIDLQHPSGLINSSTSTGGFTAQAYLGAGMNATYNTFQLEILIQALPNTSDCLKSYSFGACFLAPQHPLYPERPT